MSGQRETVWKELDRLSLFYSDELNSVKFYDKLDYIKNFSKYNEKCKSLTSLPNGERIQKTCARLLTYLETDSFSTNNDNQYDYCLLLNYWVLNNLNIFLYLKNSSQIGPAFGKIEFIWNSFIDDNLQNRRNETCKPIHSIIMDNDWRDRKELYEYYVDYSPIIETVKNYSYTCKEYYHYVENKKEIYKYFKTLCDSRNKNRCPQFYDKLEKYDPEEVITTFSCHHDIIKEREAAQRSAQQRAKALPGSETNSEGTADGMDSVGASNLNGNPHTVTKFGNVLLGVVATTMTSGALYRFTPLGGMIRNGLGWNTNNMSNINGGDIRLYDYAPEPFNPYPGEEHYIGYHPP